MSGERAIDPEASIGRYLARQRRLRGLSLDELATLTKIPRRSLERLEAGAFDGTPDGFARGFVRVVAQALGLEPDETVLRLLREPLDAGDEPEGRARVRRWLATLVALGLLGVALALTGWGLRALLSGSDSDPEPDVVFRRDSVKALVEERPLGELGPGGAANGSLEAPPQAERSEARSEAPAERSPPGQAERSEARSEAPAERSPPGLAERSEARSEAPAERSPPGLESPGDDPPHRGAGPARRRLR